MSFNESMANDRHRPHAVHLKTCAVYVFLASLGHVSLELLISQLCFLMPSNGVTDVY